MSSRHPIQRLIIFHSRLAESSLGKPLDDNASNEELCEQVLYYHSTQALDQTSSNNRNQDEAVQFMGLCTALCAIPATLDPSNNTTDCTSEVYLDHASLVFCQLEVDVLAVAQVGRRSSEAQGCTLAAVATALQQSHLVFCLLRSGGIHCRLLGKGDDNIGDVGESDFLYPGMDKLYELRRRLRKMSERESSHSNDEMEAVENEINYLIRDLPIGPLREDLKVHYEAFLGDVPDRRYGAFRNIVEGLPNPVALQSGSHALHSAPLTVSPWESARLGLTLDKLLLSIDENRAEGQSRLLGLSTFVCGKFLSAHTLPSIGAESIPSKYIHALMSYMAWFCFKMEVHSGNIGRHAQPPKIKDHFEAALSLPMDETENASSCRFLSPPPLFMQSWLNETHSFRGPRKEAPLVWAPPVFVPVSTVQGGLHDSTILRARMSLFDCGDFSFLLFLGRGVSLEVDEDESYYQDLFELIEKRTSCILNDTPTSQHIESSQARPWEGPGQDVIVVDRQIQSLILFSDPGQNGSGQSDEKDKKSRMSRARFFNSSGGSRPSPRRGSNMWTRLALGLDCRHLLASRLELDSLLAFEDAMDEVAQQRGRTSLCDVHPLEMCTFLSSRWVYTYADGERELYILFDAVRYVTVADVEDAVMQCEYDTSYLEQLLTKFIMNYPAFVASPLVFRKFHLR